MSSGNMGHFQGQFTFSDDSYSDIIEPNKAKQDSYSFVNLRAGISNDMWLAEIYIDNLTDERGEISNNYVFDRMRVTYIRPATLGLRFKKKLLKRKGMIVKGSQGSLFNFLNNTFNNFAKMITQ
jgi:hypothetical protein